MLTRLLLFVYAVCSVMAGSASAHPMAQSSVDVRILRDRWDLRLTLPADRLEVAFVQAGLVPDPGPGSDVRPKLNEMAIRTYVQDRLIGRSTDGRPWTLQVVALRAPTKDRDEWVADVRLTPPAGLKPHALLLDDQVIIREIATHSAIVSVRADWHLGLRPQTPRLIGALRAEDHVVRIDRANATMFEGVGSLFLLGMHHIAKGTDHLLFLIALLLPAPLLVQAGRWHGYGGARHTAIRLFHIVTAFTLGHSLTLILSASANWTLPQAPVEVLIALSILVSAIHAWRPVFRGREALIAGAFGLVHGMAFATVIASVGTDAWQKAAAILSFNLGIEAMQLIVIAIVVPWLILLAKAKRYHRLRLAGAGGAATASIAWAAERVTGMANPLSGAVDAVFDRAPWLIASLAAAAIAATLWQRRAKAVTAKPVAG